MRQRLATIHLHIVLQISIFLPPRALNWPNSWKQKAIDYFCNIRTQWINMLSPLKCMLEDYYHLLMKMTIDSTIVALATSKLD